MDRREFIKMHGLGNDFVVVDARARAFAVSRAGARALADRRTGIGCDQMIVLEPPRDAGADVFMRIYNADGGEVGACGNASRCIARWLFDRDARDAIVIDTTSGRLTAREAADDGRVVVDMGPARHDWREIPLDRPADTDHLPLACGPLADGVGVNIGNPHAVFFVADAAAVPLDELGPRLEHDPLFPERANIGVAEVGGDDRLRLRVWERGVGLTRACGTGACAALVAAHRRGLVGRRATVTLDGGTLEIEWRADGHVEMTGAAAISFSGSFDAALACPTDGA